MEIKKIEKQRTEETFDIEVDFGGKTIKVWVELVTFKWFDGETHQIINTKFNGFDKLKKAEKREINELINSELLPKPIILDENKYPKTFLHSYRRGSLIKFNRKTNE